MYHMEETVNEKDKVANRIFWLIFCLVLFGSIGFTFLRFVVWKNYQIVAEVACDPQTETIGALTCFHYEPEPCAANDKKCVPEEAYDYKLISKNAAKIYTCGLKKWPSPEAAQEAGCGEELSCTENEKKCSYIFCDPANLAEGEVCSTVTN